MDLTQLSFGGFFVLFAVLLAELTNGMSDAPIGTSAAVASKALTGRQALAITAIGNFIGLMIALLLGAAVAKTIGTGIVRPEIITVGAIGVAMATTVVWALGATWLGLPISKTHSLLATLAGIGYALGGFDALLPVSGHLADSGWLLVFKGMLIAILVGSAFSWFVTKIIIRTKLDTKIPEQWWRRAQVVTVCGVASGHGFNDGLKYVGIFTLVLLKSGAIPAFTVLPSVILLCAVIMAIGTLAGGWRIHRRLDRLVNEEKLRESDPEQQVEPKKPFKPYMGVATELVSTICIWQTGFLGIPMSTNHAVVSAMAGAKSANGKVHAGSLMRILWGWVVTYVFCFTVAYVVAGWLA